MTTPIKTALEIIEAIKAGKPIDREAVSACLWALVQAVRRP